MTNTWNDLAGKIIKGDDCVKVKCPRYSVDNGYLPIFGGGKINNPEVMFIMQDPSPKSPERWNESNRRNTTPEKLNEKQTEKITEWFPKAILKKLESHGIAMKNMYVTDIIKCPKRDTKAKKEKQTANECCKSFLMEEIKILNPKLIICASSFALDYIDKEKIKEETEKLSNGAENFSPKPTKIHGWLYGITLKNGVKFKLIPILHPSRKSGTLRETYLKFLEDGLRDWKN